MDKSNDSPFLSSMNQSSLELDSLTGGSQVAKLQTPDDHSHSETSTPQVSIPALGTHTLRPQRTASTLKIKWTMLLFPFFLLSYLIFCFVVDHKTVQVSLWSVQDPVSRINVIKAGVTSINILIISLAIFPLTSLVGDLQGEEFFRILTLQRNGVPLSVVNQISMPTYGFPDKLRTIIRRQSSGIFAGAFVAGLIAIVVSTLAPATLSVQVVQIDDELQAFRVGAVFRRSVWNSTTGGVFKSKGIKDMARYAASLPWVENSLGATFRWVLPDDAEDGSMYAIPTPLDVPVNSPVRYITDVVKIKPACNWYAPDLRNLTGTTSSSYVMSHALITELGWSLYIGENSFDTFEVEFSIFDTSPEWLFVTDADGSTLTNGAAVWRLVKCIPGGIGKCASEAYSFSSYGNVDITDVPNTRYVGSQTNKTYAVSFLVCRPNESVETREIMTDLSGKMSIGSSSRVLNRQHNIDMAQARFLMGETLFGLDGVSQYSGPNPHTSIGLDGLGGAVQLQLLFGNELVAKAPDDLQFVVRPIQEITRTYGKILQSSLKMFLDGTTGHGYVPGRMLKNVVIFTTSRPHLYVSTIVFIILSIFMVAAHFRTHVPQFSFVNVASSLSQSDVPGILEDFKDRNGEQALEHLDEGELRSTSIVLEGTPSLSSTSIRFR